MSAENDIKKLTIDPGAIALARMLDRLQEQVNNCCSGDNSSAKASTSAAAKTEQPKSGSADDTAK